MSTDHVLLMTDLVDSTKLSERLGDEAGAELWARHDHITRDLLRQWRGREIDKSDGFLVLFDCVEDGMACAQALHQALASMNPPMAARAGIHCGALRLRPNRDEDIRHGAKPMEVDGLAKPLAARIMGLACGGQTLLSGSAAARISPGRGPISSHGHWRFKGLSDPVELFEAHAGKAAPQRPSPTPKAYRVFVHDGQWLTLDDLPNNLPAERDGFVGRGATLAQLTAQFDSGARLVSLLGAGGIGKTRLALRYARGWLGDYPGGAWFCDLSTARGLDGIVQATALSLGLTPGPADPLERIGQAIAGRGHCLLIFDNFEQVARQAEASLGYWLAVAPQARFLVTSRELLGIAGEKALALAPMDQHEAVQLFDARAMAAHSGYRPDASDLAAMPPLMALLDHLPLAIELAAARVLVIPPHAMLPRMNQRFRLLAGRSGRHDRQATMRATLDWSWELLTAIEQSALAQLSVFDGSFSLDSAEAVIDLLAFAPAPWVADALQGLVEKSLVRQRPDDRFDLLRTVQDYATERLANMDAGATERRHWRHFAGFNEARATAARCADLDNLIAACRRATVAEPDQGVHAVVAVWSALALTGPFRAIAPLIADLENRPGLAPKLQARLHRVMGGALHHLGDLQGAERRLDQGLALLGQSDEGSAERARLLCWRSEVQLRREQFDAAATTLDEASQLAQRCADDSLSLRVLNCQGSLARAQSRFDLAANAYEQALMLAQRLDDRRWQGGLLGNLGGVRHQQGRRSEALAFYGRAVALASDLGDRQFAANTRCNLGLLQHELGDSAAARLTLDAAVLAARQLGHRRLEYTALCNLGIVTEALGDQQAALACYDQAITQAGAVGDRHSEGEFRGYLALAAARQGRHADANTGFAAAAALLEPSPDQAGLCLLYAQQALAACLAGDRLRAGSLLAQAELSAQSLELGPEAEARRLMQQARQAPTG